MVAEVGINMDFCYYCGGKPDKQDEAGNWICKKCEKLRGTVGGKEDKGMPDFPSDKAMLVDGIQAIEKTSKSWYERNQELMKMSNQDLEKLYDKLEATRSTYVGYPKKAPVKIASLGEEVGLFGTKTAKLVQSLGHFIGTERYYPHWTKSIRWTDSIQFLCEEAKAYWLMDIVASYQMHKKVRNARFQLWKIKMNPDDTALVTMQEDTGQPYLVSQEIPYTDFPLKEFEFYCIDGVCMVKSEY